MKPKFLVAWSGGLDSTAVLYWAINEIDNGDLLVKHIQLINRENRHQAEWAAIQRILPLMKKYRNFDLSVSTLDVTIDTIFNKMTDHFYCFPIIFGTAINHYSKNIQIIIILGYHNVYNIPIYIKQSIKYMKKYHPRNIKVNHINSEILMPLYNESKYISCNILPYEIAIQTHSCRIPIKSQSGLWLNCGKCIPCKKMKLKKYSFTNKTYIDQIYKNKKYER